MFDSNIWADWGWTRTGVSWTESRGELEDVHLERPLDQHLVKHQEQPQKGPQSLDQLLPPFCHVGDEVDRLFNDDEQDYQQLLLEIQRHLAEEAPLLQ